MQHYHASPFTRFSMKVALYAGHPTTFMLALSAVVIWIVSGPVFDYSDTWQLVINTGTTIITFLMVFLIQNTQNRDSEALHIKMDEIIHCMTEANNALLDLEEMDEEELHRIRNAYIKAAGEARKKRRKPDAEGNSVEG